MACNLNRVNSAINVVADSLIKDYKVYISTMQTDDSKQLYQKTAMFNAFLQNREVLKLITYESFPNVFNRLETNGFITPYEVSSFIDYTFVYTQSNFMDDFFEPYSVTQFVEYSLVTPPPVPPTSVLVVIFDIVTASNLLANFDYYLGNQYNTNSSMSSFCAMVPEIFEKLAIITNVFNNFKSLIGKISNTISKIQDAIAGKSLSQLFDVVSQHITSLFNSYVKRVENMVVSKMVQVTNMGARAASKLKKYIDDAKAFFKGDVLKEIVDVVKAQINYVMEFFKNPDIKEIQYIIMRFCTLLSTLDHIFSSQISPIQKLAQAYDETNLAFKTVSSMATSRAIRAGGIRFDEQTYNTSRNEFTGFITQRSQASGGNYNPSIIHITPQDIDGVTPWNDGKGDSRVIFSGGWVSALGEYAWINTKTQTKVALMQVQKEFGKQLIIKSCFRPTEYNAKVGGKSHSEHLTGNALDISWNGFSSAVSEESWRFINICKKYGFGGFGGYANFIHIDLGQRRDWGTLDGKVY